MYACSPFEVFSAAVGACVCVGPSSFALVCPLQPPPLLSEHALLSVLSSTLDVRRCGSRLCGGPYFACRRDVKLVHELYFPLQPSKDVAFEIGRIFMGLKDFSSAAELFRCEEELYANVMLFETDAALRSASIELWLVLNKHK